MLACRSKFVHSLLTNVVLYVFAVKESINVTSEKNGQQLFHFFLLYDFLCPTASSAVLHLP